MNILKANTGDDQLDEAYKKIQVHICTFESFESFYPYFLDVVKTEDKDKLNKWLLKVLFAEFKYGRTEVKHDFDVLLDNLDEGKKEQIQNWLKTSLENTKRR